MKLSWCPRNLPDACFCKTGEPTGDEVGHERDLWLFSLGTARGSCGGHIGDGFSSEEC